MTRWRSRAAQGVRFPLWLTVALASWGVEMAAVAELSSAQDAPPNARPRQKAQERVGRKEKGFVSLVGENAAKSWRGYANEQWPAGWKAEDDVLHRQAGGGDLMTREQYADFDLRFEWKVAEGANSGVMYHVTTGDPAPYFTGPEYQVLDDERHADGKSPLTSAGALYALYAPSAARAKPAGEWNRGRIVIRGSRIRHFLNGKKIVDAELGSADWNERLAKSKFADWEKFAKQTKGHIALQDHGDEVWYRNVRVKSL